MREYVEKAEAKERKWLKYRGPEPTEAITQ